ncbi:MAG: DNA repair protein RecO [Erysipelotrichales bacterium]|nr:DNA repair protein RecO [Erysipelotrichales bacterium]
MEIEGIIASIVQYRESDGIVNLLTADGFITFNAHGIFKIDSKLSSICQLYNFVSVDLSENRRSGYYTLKSGRILKSLKNVYENIDAMLTLGFIVELAKKTLDDDNKSKVYNCALLALDSIVNQGDLVTIRLVYLANILSLVGLKIDVDECVRCGSRKEIITLSFDDGGFVCRKCLGPSDTIKTPLYIKLARYIFITDISETINKVLPEFESRTLFKELYGFLCSQLDMKLKSYELLGKILQ